MARDAQATGRLAHLADPHPRPLLQLEQRLLAQESFDLVLLGMGSDGHTASLFPFTSALNVRKRWVAANDVPQLSTRRYTLTSLVINAASCVLFMVTGVGKAKVLRDVLHGRSEPKRLPSQMIKPIGGELLWYVDRAAASQLEQ